MIESLSAMFSEHEWHILGIMRAKHNWPFNMGIRRAFERDVYNHFQDDDPIQKVNINDYDLLVDVAESNDYNPEWRETAVKWDIPRIIYITNPAPKTTVYRWFKNVPGYRLVYHLGSQALARVGVKLAQTVVHTTHEIFGYYRNLGNWPIVYTNETLQEHWGLNGEVIHFSHDEWGIGKWKGDEATMLFGKNGYYTWGPPSDSLKQICDKLKEKFGKQFEIRDPWRDGFMLEEEWRDYVSHKRVWFDHDAGSTGRALNQGLVKAMCLGLPCVVWKTDICQGWRFIQNYENGLVTDNVYQAVNFARIMFEYPNLAKNCSRKMIEIYRENLSWEVAKPRWEDAMKRAFERYERGN